MTAPRRTFTGHDVLRICNEIRGLSVEERLKRLAKAEDLPLSGVAEDELQEVAAFQADFLRAQHLEKPPGDYTQIFYSKERALRYLHDMGPSWKTAQAALLKSMRWYVDTLVPMLKEFKEKDLPCYKDLFQDYWTEGPFGVDKRGMPVNIIRHGIRDVSGLAREVGADVVFRLYANSLEEGFLLIHKMCREHGTWRSGGICILDCAGMEFSSAFSNAKIITTFAESLLAKHYPDMLYRLYVINVPWYFDFLYRLIAPFLSAKTAEAVRVHGHGFLEALQESIDISEIPAFLGGKSEVPWTHGEGGAVPVGAGEAAAAAAAAAATAAARSSPGAEDSGPLRELDYRHLQGGAPSSRGEGARWLRKAAIPAATAYTVQFALHGLGCSQLAVYSAVWLSASGAASLVLLLPLAPLVKFLCCTRLARGSGLSHVEQQVRLHKQAFYTRATCFAGVMFGSVSLLKSLSLTFSSAGVLLVGAYVWLQMTSRAQWIEEEGLEGWTLHSGCVGRLAPRGAWAPSGAE